MNPNSGSFGAAAGGGGNAIAEAMQRRGLGGGATSQITPSAPGSPENLPPQPVGANPPQAIPSTPQQATQTGIGQPPSQAESSIIVKALSSRLQKLGDLTEKGFQV